MGGGHQVGDQRVLCLGLEEIVHLLQPLDVGVVEVVLAVLDLLRQQHLAVGALTVPINLPDAAHPLQVHDDALQAIGQLHGHRVKRKPA